MEHPIEWLPAEGEPAQLILLLHGWRSDATALLPLAQALRSQFPQAAIVAPDAPTRWGEHPTQRRRRRLAFPQIRTFCPRSAHISASSSLVSATAAARPASLL